MVNHTYDDPDYQTAPRNSIASLSQKEREIMKNEVIRAQLDAIPPPNRPLVIEIPNEVLQYREDIRRFVDAMVYKLKVHHRKGRWEDAPVEAMIEKLKGEVAELEEAVKKGNLVEVMLEAADVANYGLIVAAIAMERGK